MSWLRGGRGLLVGLTLVACGAGCADGDARRASAPPPAPPAAAPLETVPPSDATAPPVVDPANVDPAITDAATLTVTPMASEVKGARGQTVTATFRTRPGNSCQLEVRDAAGVASDRLSPTTADDQGLVSWSWNIADNATPGHATANVACSGGARGQATLVVS